MVGYRKSFVNNKKGLSLLELLIALLLLNLVLAIGYSFFYFGTRSFAIGESQSDVQQNVRMAADFITNEIRFAESLEILGSSFSFSGDYNYIYINEDSVIHRKEGTSTGTKILSGISENIDFSVNFNISSSGNNVLQFAVNGENAEKTFDIESEVMLPNVRNITINTDSGASTASGGVALRYLTPKPPEPTFRSVTIEPLEQPAGSEITVNIDLITEYVPNGNFVNVKLFWLEVISEDIEPVEHIIVEDQWTIFDNSAELDLTVGSLVPAREYNIQIDVEDVRFPYIKTYVVY